MNVLNILFSFLYLIGLEKILLIFERMMYLNESMYTEDLFQGSDLSGFLGSNLKFSF